MTEFIDVHQFNGLLKGKFPIVFGGYSGLGYEKPQAVRDEVRKLLEKLKKRYGSRLIVVSGATSVGIGLVYEVAQKLGVTTLGIVSEQVNSEDVSPFCNYVLLVSDPHGTWEVKTESGDSYLVEAAENGEMIYFGGGKVANSEILEARGKGVAVTVFSDFMPDPEKVRLKAKKQK